MAGRGSVLLLLVAAAVAIAWFLLSGPRVPGELARYPYVEYVTTNSAVISWATDDPGRGAVQLLSSNDGARTFFGAEDGRRQSIRLNGLAPGTAYEYMILHNGRPISEKYSFKTAPWCTDEPVRFFVLGDSGRGKSAQYQVAGQIERLVEEVRIDFGLHTGDIIYGDEADEGNQDARYFYPYHSIISRVPLWLSLGNHDVKPGKLEALLDLHALPGNERWYSFDYGPLHVVVLDSNQWKSQEQRLWLEKDLSASRDRPWIVVVFHHPPYAWPYADREPGRSTQGSYLKLREAWSPILEQYGVDVVFNGHSHSYQRTRLVDDYEPPGQGIYYIITGGGGGRLHPISRESVEPGLMQACVDNVYHFVSVEIEGDQFSLEAISDEGEVIDRFSFVQQPVAEPF